MMPPPGDKGTARALQPHLSNRVKLQSQCPSGVDTAPARIHQSGRLISSGQKKVCMCRFGTHTFGVSASLADSDGHLPRCLSPELFRASSEAGLRRYRDARVGTGSGSAGRHAGRYCRFDEANRPMLYLEGRDLDTRDHVIPDYFFCRTPANKFADAPGHRAYNACFSLSDEHARDILEGLRLEKAQWWKTSDRKRLFAPFKGNGALWNHIAEAESQQGLHKQHLLRIRSWHPNLSETLLSRDREDRPLFAPAFAPGVRCRARQRSDGFFKSRCMSVETFLPGCTSATRPCRGLRLALYAGH